MKILGIIVLIVAASMVIYYGCQGSSNEKISAEELREMLESNDDVVVLDVRTPEEIENSDRIGEGFHIDYLGDSFEEEVLKLDKSDTYVVYCAGGARSAKAVSFMAENGFKRLYDLDDGYNAWDE